MPVNSQWTWRDGLAVVKYNGRLFMFGGWNPALFTPKQSCNEVWTSPDDGLTWTQQTNAPWITRHSHGCVVKDGKIFVFGGDPFETGTAPKDMWVYNEAVPGTYNTSNWSQLTSDWGSAGGARIIFAPCVHNGSIYFAGGQTDFGATPTMFTDICIYNETSNQFEKTGNLPLANFSTGIMVSTGSRLYIYGGGQYNSGGHTNLNTNLYYSDDNGANWTLDSVLPAALNGMMYPNGIYFDGKLWFLNGYVGSNQRGVWFRSGNGTWTKMYTMPLSRHASTMAIDGSSFFIVSGNTRNDVIKITKNTI